MGKTSRMEYWKLRETFLLIILLLEVLGKCSVAKMAGEKPTSFCDALFL